MPVLVRLSYHYFSTDLIFGFLSGQAPKIIIPVLGVRKGEPQSYCILPTSHVIGAIQVVVVCPTCAWDTNPFHALTITTLPVPHCSWFHVTLVLLLALCHPGNSLVYSWSLTTSQKLTILLQFPNSPGQRIFEEVSDRGPQFISRFWWEFCK